MSARESAAARGTPCDCGGKGLGAGGFHYPGAYGCRRASALTIYVAGGSAERDAIAGYLVQLRAAGWHVTYDWTTDPGWTDPTHPRLTSALADVRGIAAARVFWLVAPEAKSEGSHCELGIAWMARELDGRRTGRELLASGPVDALGRVFPFLADRAFSSHADALEHLLDVAQNEHAAARTEAR